jgi:trimethylamine--corrinoid protein Co-methyltransferase
MLTDQQCETIHRASLEILRRTGVRVFHAGALQLLRDTQAVFLDGNRVYFQPSLVETALASVPPRIPLCFRGSNRVSAALEARVVSFGTGSDCLNILDPRSGEKRLFTSSDLEDCAHLVGVNFNVTLTF